MDTSSASKKFEADCDAIFQRLEAQSPPVAVSISRNALYAVADHAALALSVSPALLVMGGAALGWCGPLGVLAGMAGSGLLVGRVLASRVSHGYDPGTSPDSYALGGAKGFEASKKILGAAGVGVELDHDTGSWDRAEINRLNSLASEFPRIREVCRRWLDARGATSLTNIEHDKLSVVDDELSRLPQMKERRKERAHRMADEMERALPPPPPINPRV